MENSNKVYLDRLMILANFLRNDPRVPEHFDFNHWVDSTHGRYVDLNDQLDCQTTACAMGWATVIPQFRALGLEMSHKLRCPRIKGDAASTMPSEAAELAGRTIFGLTSEEFRHLFIPDNGLPETANHVDLADHIEKFVEDKLRQLTL